MKKEWLASLLMMIMFSCEVRGDVLNLNLMIVARHGAIDYPTRRDAIAATESALQYFPFVKIRIKTIKRVPEWGKRYLSISKVRERLFAYSRKSRAGINLFIVPVVYQDGYFWYLGGANGICKKTRAVAFATVRAGTDQASVVAVAHELGHLLGAGHTEEVSLMSPAAISLSQSNYLELQDNSVLQIQKCLGNNLIDVTL